jgi:D-aspartate ligase
LLAFRLAHGEAVDPVRARVGVGWRYASRDLVALGQEIVSRRWPNWRLRQPTTYALFAADDPVPALLELPLTLTRALTTRLPGLLARSLAR